MNITLPASLVQCAPVVCNAPAYALAAFSAGLLAGFALGVYAVLREKEKQRRG